MWESFQVFVNEYDPVFNKPFLSGLDGQTAVSVDWMVSCSLGQGMGCNPHQSGF